MYISVTGLKPNNFFSSIRFWLLAIPSFNQAKSSEGNLFCATKSVNGYQHTITAWDSKKSMKKFVASPTHLKAMNVFPEIATGFTIGYESDEIPDWDTAIARWNRDAASYN